MLSEDLKFLEHAYDVLNKKYFEGSLTRPVITIQKTAGAYGHFTPWNSWTAKSKEYPEINLGAQTLNRDLVETLATLLHEMVHQYCYDKKIKDTSSNGRYHNKRFKAEAEVRGLIIERAPGIGWSKTTPQESFKEFVAKTFKDKISCNRKGDRGGGGVAGKASSSTRKYVCPKCSMSVRATKYVRIACMDCDKQMVVEK